MFKCDYRNFQSEYLYQYCGEFVYVYDVESDRVIRIHKKYIKGLPISSQGLANVEHFDVINDVNPPHILTLIDMFIRSN